MFCKNCGKEIDSSSTFCNYCGANQGEDSLNSAAYNFGKILGSIGTIALTNKVIDDFNKKEMESMKKTSEISRLKLEKVNLMIKLNGDSISEEEYNRRCYDIDKRIEEIRRG